MHIPILCLSAVVSAALATVRGAAIAPSTQHSLTSESFATSDAANSTEVYLEGRAVKATVYKKCTVPKTAAITFDDGPYDYMYTIGAALKKAGAKGTFFFNGNNFGCIYSATNVERVKYAYSQGHQIASHGWSHQYLTNMNANQIRTELSRVDQALQKIIGVTPAFVRPAYGVYNSLVQQVAGERGQSLVIWDFDSGDATGASVSQQKAAFATLAKQRPSNVLTVNHETHANFVNQVLPDALAKLKGAGYRLVTVAECVGKAPYQKVVKASAKDASWKC